MSYDVVTLDASDREHLLARGVALERAHATARAHCGLPTDAVGVVEDECTVYHGSDEVFATVVPSAPRRAASGRRDVTLRFRVTSEEAKMIRANAKAAGHDDYGAWLRELALGEQRAEDGRARRWAELRERLRPILAAQSDQALRVFTDPTHVGARVAVLGLVAQELQLGRQLTPQEAGVVADVAAAELSFRIEQPEGDQD